MNIDCYEYYFNLFGEENKQIKSDGWKWTFSDYPKEKNGLKVFSCFACGGGSTMGYKLAGCDVLGCVEIDPKMNEIYRKNHDPKYNFLMDIRKFNELPDEEIPEELFHLDILDGSPPCTTFSMAGKREESWGKKKKFREGQAEQTLDDLSFVFIDTVKKLKPKTVIMENVEGILLGNAWQYVQKIYAKFSEAGYRMKHWLCKGEEMGVPQTRHRVFFIAVRKDIDFDLENVNMSFNYEPVTYGEIKDGTGAEATKFQKELLQYVKNTDKKLSDINERINKKSSGFTDMILFDNKVMPTITANGNIVDAENKKRISEHDIICASTFPQDYDFCKSKVRYICGMSVPPVMIKRIAGRLIESGVFDG